MDIQSYDCPQNRLHEENIAFLAKDRRAEIRGIRPRRHPTQAQVTVQTVEIGDSRQQTIGMFAHIHAKRTLPELDYGRAQRSARRRAGAVRIEQAKHAVDDGGGVG